MSRDVAENEAEADNHEAAWGAKGASWSQRAVKDDKHHCSFVSNCFVPLVSSLRRHWHEQMQSYSRNFSITQETDTLMLIYKFKWRHTASVLQL